MVPRQGADVRLPIPQTWCTPSRVLFYPGDVGPLHLGVNDPAIGRSNLPPGNLNLLAALEPDGRVEQANDANYVWRVRRFVYQ